jgi:hypothetical protein
MCLITELLASKDFQEAPEIGIGWGITALGGRVPPFHGFIRLLYSDVPLSEYSSLWLLIKAGVVGS